MSTSAHSVGGDIILLSLSFSFTHNICIKFIFEPSITVNMGYENAVVDGKIPVYLDYYQ